jgi:hypothetical protein
MFNFALVIVQQKSQKFFVQMLEPGTLQRTAKHCVHDDADCCGALKGFGDPRCECR